MSECSLENCKSFFAVLEMCLPMSKKTRSLSGVWRRLWTSLGGRVLSKIILFYCVGGRSLKQVFLRRKRHARTQDMVRNFDEQSRGSFWLWFGGWFVCFSVLGCGNFGFFVDVVAWACSGL